MGHWELSDRVMLVKLRGNPFNINITVVYAPTSDSSEEAIDQFYEILEKTKEQCKSQEVKMVVGDLNAKVGNDQDDAQRMVGKHSLGVRNDRGDRWVQWCAADSQVVTNTCYPEHPRRLWKWRSPGGEIKNQWRNGAVWGS